MGYLYGVGGVGLVIWDHIVFALLFGIRISVLTTLVTINHEWMNRRLESLCIGSEWYGVGLLVRGAMDGGGFAEWMMTVLIPFASMTKT
jgi:hypothetical protein